MNPQQLLIEAFVEECLVEMKKQKHPEPTDLFNFGLGSADAAVRRIKTKYIEKLKTNKDVDNKIF